jgi:hypothetical protein
MVQESESDAANMTRVEALCYQENEVIRKGKIQRERCTIEDNFACYAHCLHFGVNTKCSLVS